MRCFFCKKNISKRESHYYAVFVTRTGSVKRLRWCENCNKNRRSDIDKEYDRRQKIEDCEEHGEYKFRL